VISINPGIIPGNKKYKRSAEARRTFRKSRKYCCNLFEALTFKVEEASCRLSIRFGVGSPGIQPAASDDEQ
jgi:hypothetical protein